LADTIPVDEVMTCRAEPAVANETNTDLEDSELTLQKSPHENIGEKPSFSDTRLAKNQYDLLPIGNTSLFKILHPAFLSFKKDVVHLLIGLMDE